MKGAYDIRYIIDEHMKRGLKRAIVVFFILLAISFYIIVNKGHIGSYALVKINDGKTDENGETIVPQVTLELEKEYLSVKDKKDTCGVTVIKDGEIVTDGAELVSSDEDIAKVNDDNEIVPVGVGRATITAKYDGVEDSKDIQVITPIKSISFTSTNSTIKVGKDLQMKLQVTPSDASMDTITYESSDEEIATVNANGIVTGVSKGKVTITVRDSYSEIEKKVTLNIINK